MVPIHVLAEKKFSVVIDRPTLFGVSYGTNNVPGPFQGIWILAIRYPNCLEHHSVYTWLLRKTGEHSIIFDWHIAAPNSNGVFTKVAWPDRVKIDLVNWSNGIYDEAERKEIVEDKTLLDFDRLPDPVCEKGLLPEGFSITRHVIGYRDGDEVAVVVYQADDMSAIRKFHNPPLFFKWGRNLDQSYRMDRNAEWLAMLEQGRDRGDND